LTALDEVIHLKNREGCQVFNNVEEVGGGTAAKFSFPREWVRLSGLPSEPPFIVTTV
jgi:hypothetical protein